MTIPRHIAAYSIHLFTASGLIFAFLALVATLEDQPLAAFAFLAVALVIDGVDEGTANELQARARDVLEAINKAALENARSMGVEDSLVEFEGLTPQMIEALAKDDVKTLEDFATCADWELAGGWTTVDGERVKDDGVLEPFDVTLEEAQDLIMTARIMLGWVDPADLEAAAEEEAGEETEEAEV